MFGKLSVTEIDALLTQQLVGRIGCSADETVYVVPVSYAYEGDYIYVRSLPGMKIDLMRKNSKVCFQVDKLEDMANWQSVIAWGEFEELQEKTSRNEALQKLVDRNLPHISSVTTQLSAEWPFPEHDISTISGIVFRIRILNKTGRFERSKIDAGFAS